MKSKINFSILLAIFPVVFFAGAVLFYAQNSGAQVDIEACQSEYNQRRSQCIANNTTCVSACGEDQACELNCNNQRNTCDEAATDEQRKCLGVWPYNQGAGSDLPMVDAQPNPADAPAAQPPKTSTSPPVPPAAQSTLPQDQTSAEKKDNTAKTDADLEVTIDPEKLAKFTTAVKQEAKQIKSIKECEGPVLPSQNPCVAEKLDFFFVEARESNVMISFFDKPRNAEPKVLEQNEKREITGFQDFFPLTPDVDLKKLNEALDSHEAGWQSAEKAFIDSARGFGGAKNPRAMAADGSAFSLANIEKDGQLGSSAFATVEAQAEISSPSVIATGEKPAQIVHPDKMISKIAPRSVFILQTSPAETGQPSGWQYTLTEGGVQIDKSAGSQTALVRTPLTETKSKNTKFAVLYNSEELYAATVVYEGEVEVTDLLNGFTAKVTPTKDGKPRAMVVPLEKDQQLPAARTLAQRFLIFVLPTLLFIVFGYLVYRYKKAVAARTAK